jgi:hypothetical protein
LEFVEMGHDDCAVANRTVGITYDHAPLIH